MFRILQAKFNPPTGQVAKRIIRATLTIIVVLLAPNDPVLAQSNQDALASPRVVYLDGFTDNTGDFAVPTQGLSFDYAQVAVQHQNGDWHTLENSKEVYNNFWWDNSAVRGEIHFGAYYNRPVRVFLYSGFRILTGKTRNDGYFAVPIQGAQFDYALVAIQHRNGHWHTLERSNQVANRFWWNQSDIQGQIASPDFYERDVRVILLSTGDNPQGLNSISIINGKTQTNGHFAVSIQSKNVMTAMVAVQHNNGNWHTLELSNQVSNNFWWNYGNKTVQGWIESSNFREREVRVIAVTTQQVSGGGYHTCLLRADSSLACWGDNSLGQAMSPAGTFIRVSAGGLFTCGLKTDGSLACWGDNRGGQASPPSGTFNLVGAGFYHACGQKADGTLACWGSNYFGRATPPPGTFIMFSAGGNHNCGLKTDRSLACWGDNSSGQATPPYGTFTQVSAGGEHTCGVRVDGSLVCWGSNDYGQAIPPAGTFIQVSAGGLHTCGLKADGSLACWGNNAEGQASPPAGTFTQVSAGFFHTCGLRVNGSLTCWGSNHFGQALWRIWIPLASKGH